MLDLAKVSWVITFVSRLLSILRAIKKNALIAHSPTPSMPPPWKKYDASARDFSVVRIPPAEMVGLVNRRTDATSQANDSRKLDGKMKRKRPETLIIPGVLATASSSVGLEGSSLTWCEVVEEARVMEVEGNGYCVVSKKGWRNVMEDGHAVITDICDDPKQAYFGVFDGHGGRGAVEFVTEKLGKNIVSAITGLDEREKPCLEEAIKMAYLKTDREFLSQGVNSGACAATVLVRDGSLYTANAGDCRVVLSRSGVAMTLTSDHRVEWDDERARIEKWGGYVDCINGVWRVQGILAVSRAIGDLHLKDWVISEPDINRIYLTQDCEFFIMASDGLWDKVSSDEAVEVVSKSMNTIESCRKLEEMSSGRGNRDDITIMIVDLDKFM